MESSVNIKMMLLFNCIIITKHANKCLIYWQNANQIIEMFLQRKMQFTNTNLRLQRIYAKIILYFYLL